MVQLQTNFKQGTLIGGWASIVVAVLFMASVTASPSQDGPHNAPTISALAKITADFQAGYVVGQELGYNRARGADMPLPSALPKIADAQWNSRRPAFDEKTWKAGLIDGFASGFNKRKSGERLPTPSAMPTEPTASNGPGRGVTTKAGYLASPSLELFEKASSYIGAKDEAALAKLMATGLVIQLKAGLDVQIVDTKIFSGLVKIRPRGQTIELWTNIEAVKF